MAKARTTADDIVYATLQELQSEKPLEDDIKVRDRWYHVRGMTMHEVNNVVKWSTPYQEYPAIHLAKDEAFTIAIGLVTPSFGAISDEDFLAAVIMIEQWPKEITQKIAGRIRELTWPQYTEQVEPEPLEVPEG